MYLYHFEEQKGLRRALSYQILKLISMCHRQLRWTRLEHHQQLS